MLTLLEQRCLEHGCLTWTTDCLEDHWTLGYGVKTSKSWSFIRELFGPPGLGPNNNKTLLNQNNIPIVLYHVLAKQWVAGYLFNIPLIYNLILWNNFLKKRKKKKDSQSIKLMSMATECWRQNYRITLRNGNESLCLMSSMTTWQKIRLLFFY